MDLFRDLGRRAEKLKREATEAAGETADYECADCEKPLFTERSACPDCGSESVVAREAESGSEPERDASSESRDDASSDSTGDTDGPSERSDRA